MQQQDVDSWLLYMNSFCCAVSLLRGYGLDTYVSLPGTWRAQNAAYCDIRHGPENVERVNPQNTDDSLIRLPCLTDPEYRLKTAERIAGPPAPPDPAAPAPPAAARETRKVGGSGAAGSGGAGGTAFETGSFFGAAALDRTASAGGTGGGASDGSSGSLGSASSAGFTASTGTSAAGAGSASSAGRRTGCSPTCPD